MLTATQTAALKRVTKKLTAMRKALPKAEREMLDSLILGSTPEVKGHRALAAQARAEAPAKKISKRSQGARAEVEGHMADWRLGAMKDQGMLKDAGAVREGGMAKDSAAAEVQGHMADWRLGAMKDQGMLKDAGAVREGGMAKDSAAAEVQGHMATVTNAASIQNAAHVSAAAADARASIAFNAALSAYVVADK